MVGPPSRVAILYHLTLSALPVEKLDSPIYAHIYKDIPERRGGLEGPLLNRPTISRRRREKQITF